MGLSQLAWVDLRRESLFEVEVRLLNKTSSYIGGSWYFAMFLLRDRSLTLMNMASLMVLLMVSDSLPTGEIVQFGFMT